MSRVWISKDGDPQYTMIAMEGAGLDADIDIAVPSSELRLDDLLPRLEALCFSDHASYWQSGLGPSPPLP